MGVDLEHGQIGAGVVEQDRGRELAPVAEHHHDLGPALDDVMVGDDHPVGAHHHARTERLLDALARGDAEHLPERIDLLAHDAAAEHIDHRRGSLLHHRGEGQPHAGRVGRRAAIGDGEAALQGLGAGLAGMARAGGQGESEDQEAAGEHPRFGS